MSNAQTNRLKIKARYLAWIGEIDRCIQAIAVSGTASASLSAGGGSQSYTHADIDKLRKLRGVYASRVQEINMALAAWPNNTGIRHIQTVRCGGFWQ